MVILGGGAFSYERDTPVRVRYRPETHGLHHSLEYAGFVPLNFRGLRDQICTTQRPEVNELRDAS